MGIKQRYEEIKQRYEEIKQRYEKSNKYMLCVTYEDIGILIHIIEVLDKLLKYRKEETTSKEEETSDELPFDELPF